MPLIQIEDVSQPGAGQLGALPPFRRVTFQPRPKPVQNTPAPISFVNRPRPGGPVDTPAPAPTPISFVNRPRPGGPVDTPAPAPTPVSFVNRPRHGGPVDTFPISLPPFRPIPFQPRPNPVPPVIPMRPSPRLDFPVFDRPIFRGGDATTAAPNDGGTQPPLDLFMSRPGTLNRYPVSLPPFRPLPGVGFVNMPQPTPDATASLAALAPLQAQLQALQSQETALQNQVNALQGQVSLLKAPAPVQQVVGAPAPAPVAAPAVVGAPAPAPAPSAALASMFAAPSGSSLYASVGAPTTGTLYAHPQESGSLFATVSRAGALSGLPAEDEGHALLWATAAGLAAWWFLGRRKGRR